METNGNLRELVAGLIASNPNKYDSALLGQSNRTYVQWLQKKESWGGTLSCDYHVRLLWGGDRFSLWGYRIIHVILYDHVIIM